ncbi:MAG: MinD/ParA family protein [Clostridiales bacterium]|nr:MinD/ParA family protein [Clostridiales bacterium]
MDQASQLRDKIKMQPPKPHLARVITVTSGKGGVGKSSISVNLALQLSRLGKKVIILDADFGLANVEVMLGIRPRYTLADLMFRGKELNEIITTGPEQIGFISGGSGIQELSNLSKEQIVNLTGSLYVLDELADYVIIDTGAGISDAVLEFVTSCSEVLLVATPEPTSITDAYALLKTLNKRSEYSTEHTAIKMIANRVGSREEGKALFDKLSVVVNKFLQLKVEFLGAIPMDNSVPKALMQQKPFSLAYPKSEASRAVAELAAILDGHVEEEDKEQKGIKELFSNVIRTRFRKKQV